MGGLPLYRLSRNDPVKSIDPFGLQGYTASPPTVLPPTEAPVGPGIDFISHYIDGTVKHWPPLSPYDLTSVNAFHEIGDHLVYGGGKDFDRTDGSWGEFMK